MSPAGPSHQATGGGQQLLKQLAFLQNPLPMQALPTPKQQQQLSACLLAEKLRAHQHSCIRPCLRLGTCVQIQLLAPLLSFLRDKERQPSNAVHILCMTRHPCWPATHDPYLEQLLGVLAEAIGFAQVEGAKVCIEGLIQLQSKQEPV